MWKLLSLNIGQSTYSHPKIAHIPSFHLLSFKNLNTYLSIKFVVIKMSFSKNIKKTKNLSHFLFNFKNLTIFLTKSLKSDNFPLEFSSHIIGTQRWQWLHSLSLSMLSSMIYLRPSFTFPLHLLHHGSLSSSFCGSSALVLRHGSSWWSLVGFGSLSLFPIIVVLCDNNVELQLWFFFFFIQFSSSLEIDINCQSGRSVKLGGSENLVVAISDHWQ